MKMVLGVVLALTVLPLPAEEASWVGRSAEELVESWGEPSFKRKSGDGGWVYVYRGHRRVTVEGGRPGEVYTGRDPGSQSSVHVEGRELPGSGPVEKARFVIDASGRITEYRFAPEFFKRIEREGLALPPGVSRTGRPIMAEVLGPGALGEKLWEVRGVAPPRLFVYASPATLADTEHLQARLRETVEAAGGQAVEVLIFDDPKYTPRRWPLANLHRRHHKARYEYRADGSERFVWLTVRNPAADPVVLSEREAPIGIGER